MPRSIAALTLAFVTCILRAQSPLPNPPSFEVATIKPADPSFVGILIRLTGGKFSATGFTLKDLIAFAYAVDNSQIGGGAEWPPPTVTTFSKTEKGRPAQPGCCEGDSAAAFG